MAEAAILASPPAPARDWKPIVDALTRDEAKRAALMTELASLDEMERAYRPYVLRGNAMAGMNVIKIKKLRADLLHLLAADADAGFPGEIDVPDWTPLLPEERPIPPLEDLDDAV